MRRPRCGTCRHWINDEGGVPYCKRFPPTAHPDAPFDLTKPFDPTRNPMVPRSAFPIVPPFAGCAEHKYHTRRLLKTLWERLLGGQGNRPPLQKPTPQLTHDNRSVS